MDKIGIILESYIKYSKILVDAGFRRPNFPEGISEKISLEKYYSKPFNKGKSGDLECEKKKFEVKCFTSNGPISFGPTESWNSLIFVDGRRYKEKYFIVYEYGYSNEIQTLLVSKNETFNSQIINGRRPRLNFSFFINQNNNFSKLKIIYEGYFMSNEEKLRIFLKLIPKSISIDYETYLD